MALPGGTFLSPQPLGVIGAINNATGFAGSPTIAPLPAPTSGPAPTNTQTTPTNTNNNVSPTGTTANVATTNFLAGLPGLLGNIHSSSATEGLSSGAGLTGSINDLVTQLGIDQRNIDHQGVQNEESKLQGTAGVLSMIQHGLQSGGVNLANRGASSSSAAEALARAYSDIGRRAQSQVGQQYAKGQSDIDLAQTNFNANKAGKMSDIQTQKSQAINNIVDMAQSKLAYLDAQAVSSGAPNSVNIDAEKDAVRREATAQLAYIDGQLNQGVATVNPLSQADRQGQAANLLQQGQAPANQFSYTTAGPLQVQNSGPVAAQLPIFTNPSKKTV